MIYRERFHSNGQLAERWSDEGYIAVDSRGRAVEQRALTDDETAAIALPMQRMAQALASDDAFLALESPTAAEMLTQLRRLTRQVSYLVRLQIREAEGHVIDPS